MFMTADPIPAAQVNTMTTWLDNKLSPLKEAVQKLQPLTFIGSSGTFDTLVEMENHGSQQPHLLPSNHLQIAFELPVSVFKNQYSQLLEMSKAERLTLPGMHPKRASMIVVACILIDYLLGLLPFKTINTSSYAVKEGILAELLASK